MQCPLPEVHEICEYASRHFVLEDSLNDNDTERVPARLCASLTNRALAHNYKAAKLSEGWAE